MKNKRGFTLIELLAVIAIIGLLTVLIYPNVMKYLNKGYESIYTSQVKSMEKAASNYISSNLDMDLSGEKKIELSTLTEGKYINKIKDPKTKQECDGYVIVTNLNNKLDITGYLSCGDNYVTEGYKSGPQNANVHEAIVPSGYTGIYTIEDLNNMRSNLSGKYILMKDLDFNSDASYATPSNKTTYTTGVGWNPVGPSLSSLFTGTFNGNNHVINNLFINRPTTDYIGLFGYVSGSIVKLGLENTNVTGKNNVGGIAGSSYGGSYENCYTTGIVSGTNYVGGLLGSGNTYANINKSYSISNVTGAQYVGGITGSIYTTISNSFAAGNVTGTTYVGGLTGTNDTITNSYRSSTAVVTATSGTPNSYGTVITPDAFKSGMFISGMLNWDYQNTWYINNKNHPKLGGTTEETYAVANEIKTIEDLYMMRKNLTGSYTLMNDLDFNNSSDYKYPINKTIIKSPEGWLPIGSSLITRFNGTFNGNNHVIKNLYINRPTTDYVGLFGYAAGSILRLGLENINVTGQSSVGGIAGESYGGLYENCYTTGSVTGINAVGGLLGAGNTYANINKSYSISNVTGTTNVGGLTGSIYTTISNSFAAGNVTGGTSNIGGLCGGVYTLTNSYRSNTAAVTMSSGTPTTHGTLASPTDLQSLSLAGLTTWDKTNIWKINSGLYPTFK